MTETLAPEFPAAREARCPFAPPPALREAAAGKPVSKVRIWDGSTHWMITGHAEQRAILSDPRVSMNEKLPGFPHQDEGSAANVHAAAGRWGHQNHRAPGAPGLVGGVADQEPGWRSEQLLRAARGDAHRRALAARRRGRRRRRRWHPGQK